MAKVTITFEDGDQEQMITYDSSNGTSLDSNLESMTDAEYLAATAIILLQDFLDKQGANIEFQRKSSLN